MRVEKRADPDAFSLKIEIARGELSADSVSIRSRVRCFPRAETRISVTSADGGRRLRHLPGETIGDHRNRNPRYARPLLYRVDSRSREENRGRNDAASPTAMTDARPADKGCGFFTGERCVSAAALVSYTRRDHSACGRFADISMTGCPIDGGIT